MRVIGIDPGIERVGIGIVDVKGSSYSLAGSFLIKTLSALSTEKRLAIIHQELTELIVKYKPDEASIEELFFAKNVKTALIVAQARGVLLLVCAQQNIPLSEYTPLQVKQAISGYGRADKTMMQRMLRMILGNIESIDQDDVADGIALAITHINMNRILSKINKKVK